MRINVLLVISTLLASSALAEKFGDVEYYAKKAGSEKTDRMNVDLTFDTDAKAVTLMSKKQVALSIPYADVTDIVYERASKPRYAAGMLLAWPLLFTKSKQHFLTLQYKGQDGQGKYAVLRLDKGNFREVLASAEASTGKKVDRREEK